MRHRDKQKKSSCIQFGLRKEELIEHLYISPNMPNMTWDIVT